MSQWQQEVDRQERLVELTEQSARLADRTARAVETIRTIVVVWAILSLFGAVVLLFEVTKAARGS